MKKFNLFWGGLMAIAFTACTNEELLQEGNSNAPSAEQVTITAYTPGDDSASSRSAQTMEGTKIKLGWDGTDVISVTRGSNFVNFISLGGNDFESPNAPIGEGNFYAVYPAVAEETVAAPTAVPFDLSNQTGADTYLMYSESESGKIYQFRHAAAYLKATFPGELKNTTATITLTVPEGIYTKGTIDLTNGTLSPNNEYKNTIIKTVEFGASTEVWFALPPMAANNKTLNFTIKTASNSYSATLAGSAEKAIEAGKYYSASITMVEGLTACELPAGSDFRTAMSSAVSGKTVNSIVFSANSARTDGTQISTSNAYTIVDENTSTLYVYTAADEFVFNADCDNMFYQLFVKTINFNNCINTSNVTSMSGMFKECLSLQSLDLSCFNTSNVTSMNAMFYYCQFLKSLDLSSFNTSQVTDMCDMFYRCQELKSLDFSKFNTSNVIDMHQMFYKCEDLESLVLGNNFTTRNVKNMADMFQSCETLTSLDLSNFNTSKVTDMSGMFKACINLNTIVWGQNFQTTNVTTMKEMFRACQKLTTLDLCNFTFYNDNNYNYQDMFYQCSALTKIYLKSEDDKIILKTKSTYIEEGDVEIHTHQ